jgi:YidC/Oxa1 family membrane protein insertase
MQVWMTWLDALNGLLNLLSSEVGLGAGLGIVALTLLLRVTLLPISWSTAYRGCVRQKRIMQLQPEVQRIKDRFADDPSAVIERTMALYRKHGLSPMDGRSLLGALAQMPVFLGMFQVLREYAEGARFLWVSSLSRPDALLALIAGATTALMMAANPDLPEHMRALLIIVPSVIAVLVTFKFCSALAVYWAASNCFSAAQTVAVHYVVARHARLGTR